MLDSAKTFSSFSVDSKEAAKKFYKEVLGLKVTEDDMGLTVHTADQKGLFIYEKPDHKPATFTVLNFLVEDVEKAVKELDSKGVKFEKYPELGTDDKGIARGDKDKPGPDIAWFKDPAGNVLSVLNSSL